MADLFKEIIPSIMKTKEDVLDNEKDYVPFVVNRHLSYYYDCVMFANEMNKLPSTDNAMQYHYLLNRVRSVKRPFTKWYKREDLDDIEIIKEYYGFSTEKAKIALQILNDEQINDIKNKISKGGLNDKSKSG